MIVNTYAFYDNGSSGCFIKESVSDLLQTGGIETAIKLQTMHGIEVVPTKIINNLVVYDAQGNNPLDLPKAFARKEVPISDDQIPKREALQSWQHLSSIIDSIPEYDQSLDIGILIGSNCPKAIQPLQVIPTTGNGPFAVRYLHGWTVHGPMQVNVVEDNITCNRVLVSEVERVSDCITAETVSKSCSLDFSEHDVGTIPEERDLSYEDRRCLKTMKESTTRDNGHYQIAMPFKKDKVFLPNNRGQAVSRLKWQKKKIMNNDEHRIHYTEFVEKLLAKGYAYKVPRNQLYSSQVWYLPHHGVYHPQEKKLRVVFDCSARYNRVYSNDMLLQGPDLAKSLVGTLLRFREGHVAFTADIEAMYHQIKVPPNQHDYLGFLWWPNGNMSQPAEEYNMSVHIFGAVSSPSIANYALKLTADRTDEAGKLLAGKTIRNNFYIDDCLKSCNDVNTAIQFIEDLSDILAEQGFNLTKFVSNHTDFLASVPIHKRATNHGKCNLDFEQNTTRALGMLWHLHDDTFRISPQLKNTALNRSGLLSKVCSLYDPSGFLSPFILPAKRIIQELCKDVSIGWGSEIPPECMVKWEKWEKTYTRVKS